jgi:hypothetical protein
MARARFRAASIPIIVIKGDPGESNGQISYLEVLQDRAIALICGIILLLFCHRLRMVVFPLKEVGSRDVDGLKRIR